MSVPLGDAGIACAVGAECATGVHQNEALTFSGVSCLVLTTRHCGKNNASIFGGPSSKSGLPARSWLHIGGTSGFHATLLVALSRPAHTLWMVLLHVPFMCKYSLHILVQVGAVRCRFAGEGNISGGLMDCWCILHSWCVVMHSALMG